MDEVIGRLVANVGIDRAAAEKAVGIILDFLAKEGPPDKVRSFLAKLPGAGARRSNAHDGRQPEHGESAERQPAIQRLCT